MTEQERQVWRMVFAEQYAQGTLVQQANNVACRAVNDLRRFTADYHGPGNEMARYAMNVGNARKPTASKCPKHGGYGFMADCTACCTEAHDERIRGGHGG